MSNQEPQPLTEAQIEQWERLIRGEIPEVAGVGMVSNLLATIRALQAENKQAQVQTCACMAALVLCEGTLALLFEFNQQVNTVPEELRKPISLALKRAKEAIDTTAGQSILEELNRLRGENARLHAQLPPDRSNTVGAQELRRWGEIADSQGQAEHDAKQDAMAGAEDMED